MISTVQLYLTKRLLFASFVAMLAVFVPVLMIQLISQLPQSALHRGDLIQLSTSPQKDTRLPVRLIRLINLTTMQPLTPRIPTMWSHLGPALMLQAVLGGALLLAAAAFWLN